MLLLMLLLVGCTSEASTATRQSTSTDRPTPTTANGSAPPLTATVRPVLTPLPAGNVLPSTIKPECKPLAVSSSLPISGRAGEVWYAEQIIIGNVVAQETRWEGNTSYQVIMTYSLVRVAERVRGVPLDEVIVEQRGGTVDGCTQMNSDRIIRPGESLLLFLWFGETLPGQQGALLYSILSGEYNVIGSTRAITGTPVTTMTAEARRILSQPPPLGLSKERIIPLDRAPLVPPPTVTPQR